jgi:hypothetical protein
MKYWEIIADNLSKAEWSWGCVAAVDSEGRTIRITDAHRDDGKRFVVRLDEKLTAFIELESAGRGRPHRCETTDNRATAYTRTPRLYVENRGKARLSRLA